MLILIDLDPLNMNTRWAKKSGTQLNGSITAIFQPISLKFAVLVVQPFCDTHTKNQVNPMIRTCSMRYWVAGIFYKAFEFHPNWQAIRWKWDSAESQKWLSLHHRSCSIQPNCLKFWMNMPQTLTNILKIFWWLWLFKKNVSNHQRHEHI